jgi:integrase
VATFVEPKNSRITLAWVSSDAEDAVNSRRRSTQVARSRKHRLGELELYRTLDSLPPRWRPFFVTLFLTGLRTAELCELEPQDLDHEVRAIRLRDSERDVHVVYVAENLWPWVVAAVPVPVRYSYLRLHWQAAVDRAELGDVSVRDLQRLRARLLAEAGVGYCLLRFPHTDPDENRSIQKVRDRRSREEAQLFEHLLPALVLTDDEARRLLVRRVEG